MIIGITGGIGSGKSTVGRFLAKSNATVLEADEIAGKFIARKKIQQKIVHIFGKSILDLKRNIRKKKLANIVFRDVKKLRMLEAILHPLVIHEIKRQISSSIKTKRRDTSGPLLAIIVPLLFEKKLEYLFDLTVAVTCPKALRIARGAKHLKMSSQDVMRRMHHQMDPHKQKKYADEEIKNNGSKHQLKKNIEKFLEKIKEDSFYGSNH